MFYAAYMKATPTVPVRITARRYAEIRRIAKKNGHTLSWLLNFIIDLYLQDRRTNLELQGASEQK